MSDRRNEFARVTASALSLVGAVQTATWAASRRVGRVNVADVAWGPGIAGVTAVSALLGTGDRLRGTVLVSGVSVWAVRLSTRVHRNSAGRGEDPRYAEMLQGAGRSAAIRKVFLPQGGAQWLVSLPAQVAAVSGPPRGGLGRAAFAAGTVVMVAGGLTEAVADRQKAVWKADPQHGSVMDRGLWAWSRHPNYFGDACFWWGIYLIAAAARPGAWTIVSPVVMTWSLVRTTGAGRAERMRRDDPDYQAYQRRVPFFVPRPPRSADSS